MRVDENDEAIVGADFDEAVTDGKSSVVLVVVGAQLDLALGQD